MTNQIGNLKSYLFTIHPQRATERVLERAVFQPEERVCPHYMTLLAVHKVLHGRAIIGLRDIKVIKEIQLRCPHEECPGRVWDQTKQKFCPPSLSSSVSG